MSVTTEDFNEAFYFRVNENCISEQIFIFQKRDSNTDIIGVVVNKYSNARVCTVRKKEGEIYFTLNVCGIYTELKADLSLLNKVLPAKPLQ